MELSEAVGIIILCIGILLITAAYVIIQIKAFEIHNAWGWAILLFQPLLVIFIPIYWDDSKKPLGISIIGTIVTLIGFKLAKI
jgi:hypothetical protein